MSEGTLFDVAIGLGVVASAFLIVGNLPLAKLFFVLALGLASIEIVVRLTTRR